MTKIKIKGFDEVQEMLKEYREGGALELKQYRAIGTVEECRDARERQRAKKPVMKPFYEDLEERLHAVYGECDGLLEMVVEHLERHENVDIPEPVFKARLLTDEEVDRWEEYKNLEEQGKLLKLPCKAGQRVYLLRKDIKRIIDGEITSITISEFSSGIRIFIVDDNRYTDASFDKIGEIVFFTQEAGEAALKEMSE